MSFKWILFWDWSLLVGRSWTLRFSTYLRMCGGDGKHPIPILNLWEFVVNFYSRVSSAHKSAHVSFPLPPAWKVLLLLPVCILPLRRWVMCRIFGCPFTPNRSPEKPQRLVVWGWSMVWWLGVVIGGFGLLGLCLFFMWRCGAIEGFASPRSGGVLLWLSQFMALVFCLLSQRENKNKNKNKRNLWDRWMTQKEWF